MYSWKRTEKAMGDRAMSRIHTHGLTTAPSPPFSRYLNRSLSVRYECTQGSSGSREQPIGTNGSSYDRESLKVVEYEQRAMDIVVQVYLLIARDK